MADTHLSNESSSTPVTKSKLAQPYDGSSHPARPVVSVDASVGVPTTLVGHGWQDTSMVQVPASQDALASATTEASVLPLSAPLAIDWTHMAAMGWPTSTALPPGMVPPVVTTEPSDTWGQSFLSAFGYPIPTIVTPTVDLEHLNLMDTAESHGIGSASAPTLPLALDTAVSEGDTEATHASLAALWQASVPSWPHPALAEWSTAASMDELTSGWYMGHLPGLTMSQFDTASMLPLTVASGADYGLIMDDDLSAWTNLSSQTTGTSGHLGQTYPPTIALPVLSHAFAAQPSGGGLATPEISQALPGLQTSVSASEPMETALRTATHTVAPRRRRRGKRTAVQTQSSSASGLRVNPDNNQTQSSPVISQLHSSPFDSTLQSTFGPIPVSSSSAPLTPAGPYFDPAVLAAAFGSHPSASAGMSSCGQQFLHHPTSCPGYVSSPAIAVTAGPSTSLSSPSSSATSTARSSCSSTVNVVNGTRVLAFPSYTNKGEIKQCQNCKCINTPSWRRSIDGKTLLCNACGLYYKLHHINRPCAIGPDGLLRVVRARGSKVTKKNGTKAAPKKKSKKD